MKFRLWNSGGSTINWSAATSIQWLNLSPAGGALPAGATVDVALTINKNASKFFIDNDRKQIAFTNHTSGARQYRSVFLSIADYRTVIQNWNLYE
jgi:hypothetical protein